jgi:hypothetical protein
MVIFSTVDKKVLMVSFVTIILILIINFLIYKYLPSPIVEIQNLNGGAQTEVK